MVVWPSRVSVAPARCPAAAAPRTDASPDPAGELVILPERIVLRGQGSRQQLLVEARAGGTLHRRSHRARRPSRPRIPNVATVDDAGVVTAVGDGRAIITARDGEASASTVVEVERASAPYPLSFRNHVVPVLTKAGCNSGPCHGAAGRQERIQADAARIRSRGRLPDADAAGRGARRINKVEPARSLMLLKPTLAVSHGGGKRFCAALARVSRDRGLDRGRHAGAGRLGSGDDAPRGVSAPRRG